jgi:hypothetical protein
MKKEGIKRKGVWGIWIEKPRQKEILVCECGNKYIKTRDKQTSCVRCIAENRECSKKVN